METLWTAVNNLFIRAEMVYRHDQINWNVSFVVILLLILGVLLPKGLLEFRGRMMHRARMKEVRETTIDALTHWIEEQVYSGGYTRNEARELYRDLKKCFPVKDLFPNPELLKEAIKKRRASGIHFPPPLPGKKKLKHAFDKS